MEEVRRIPPLLRKILTTTASGGTTLLITILAQQSLVASINLSLLVGGVALLVEFLVEFEERLDTVEKAQNFHAEAMRALVAREFAQISAATRLFDIMDKAPLGPELDQLVRNAAQIDERVPPIVRVFAEKEIQRLALMLHQLHDGQPVYDGEDQDWLLTLTRSASDGIDAVSTAVDIGFWNTELGRRYINAQRAAVQRRVRVRRVFVLNEHGQETVDEILWVGSTQAKLGVEVRMVARRDLPAWAKAPNPDFIVFDRAISYEVSTDEGGQVLGKPLVARTWLELTEDNVAKRMQRFEDLWAVAQPVV